MTPALPGQDARDRICLDAVIHSEFTLGDATRAVTLVDCDDVSDGQFLNSARGTALVGHVTVIVEIRAEEQVFDTHAGAVIATVTNEDAGRDWAIGQFPRETVSGGNWLIGSMDDAVPALGMTARPFPASRSDDAHGASVEFVSIGLKPRMFQRRLSDSPAMGEPPAIMGVTQTTAPNPDRASIS